MSQLPHIQKKKNVMVYAGMLVLLLGVFVTINATQHSTEVRQFAQAPISYPTPSENPLYSSIPVKWETRFVRVKSTDFWIRYGNTTYHGSDNVEVHTNYSLDNQTLEMTWKENGALITLNMYFRRLNGNMWHMYQITSNNSAVNSQTISYRESSNNQIDALIGYYNYQDQRTFVPETPSNADAEIYCKNCFIEAFRNPPRTVYSSGYALDTGIGTAPGKPIKVTPFGNSAYGVSAILFNSSNNVVNDRSAFDFEWSSDSPNIVSVQKGSTDGLSPYIATHGTVTGVNFGIATISVKAINKISGQVVASVSFPVEVTESTYTFNTAAPTCTLGVYADSINNHPPSYDLSTVVQTVNPNEQIVIATNFFNNTQKQYQKMSYHIDLGEYFQFVDSNGSNCSYDATSKTIKCDHGVFVDQGATSMAFRVKYKGVSPASVGLFGTAFASNGDTGSCSTTLNKIGLVP